MAVDMRKGTWTVGWNRPGWSCPVERAIEYPFFRLAYEGFVAILKGEGSRQVLTDSQRVRLNQLLSYLDGREQREIDFVQESGGEAELVGNTIFWLWLVK